jgi:ArsR family transcriptional regulator, zinc-responsive transcriptional repressor
MEDIYELFKVLSDRKRLEILELLLEEGYSVNDIIIKVGTTQPNVSQHLKVLKESGLIIVTKKGRTCCYVVRRKPKIIRIIRYAREMVEIEE